MFDAKQGSPLEDVSQTNNASSAAPSSSPSKPVEVKGIISVSDGDDAIEGKREVD